MTVWKCTTQELKTAFKAYCNPRKNLTFERHEFNTRDQDENETIDQYITALRNLAATCEFESLHDGLIRDSIVCGIRTQSLKEHMMREDDLTLEKAIDICRAAETSRHQLKSLCGEITILYDKTDETAPLTQRHHRKTTIYHDKGKHAETVANFMHPKHVQHTASLVITVIS